MSSQYYYLFICLFLLSFSSLINSQEDQFVVAVGNDASKTVTLDCSLEGVSGGVLSIEPKEGYRIVAPYDSSEANTLSCEIKLGEKHGVFTLFESNNTKICHDKDGDCEWRVREDGLCMLVANKCVVMLKWDSSATRYSFRKITSEPIKYDARNAMRYVSNNP